MIRILFLLVSLNLFAEQKIQTVTQTAVITSAMAGMGLMSAVTESLNEIPLNQTNSSDFSAFVKLNHATGLASALCAGVPVLFAILAPFKAGNCRSDKDLLLLKGVTGVFWVISSGLAIMTDISILVGNTNTIQEYDSIRFQALTISDLVTRAVFLVSGSIYLITLIRASIVEVPV